MLKILIEIPSGLKSAIDRGYTSQVITSKLWEAAHNGTIVDYPEDAISRKMVNDLIDELARAISDKKSNFFGGRRTPERIMSDILHLPSVLPKAGTESEKEDIK